MIYQYLIKLFGDEAITKFEVPINKLPYILIDGYKFEGISIYNRKYVFAHPNSNTNLKSFKVQRIRMQEYLSTPVVLCVNSLNFQQKTNLISNRIEFVEIDKQLFMPSAGLVLNDYQRNISYKTIDKFSPQIQLCALFFYYSEIKEYTTDEIANAIGLNNMAVSRGIAALNELNVLSTRTNVRTNYYQLRVDKIQYFINLKDYLISPVQRKLVIKKEDLIQNATKAGYTALSKFTDIVDNNEATYAISKDDYKAIENKCKRDMDEIIPDQNNVNIEIWKYNPTIFANDGCVDKLSLYLSFDHITDERTEHALEELMN